MPDTFDVDRFIDDLKRARREGDGQKAVEGVLARVASNPKDLLRGLGEPKEAGLHTLYRADDLTVLNVIWAPLMILLPHNHNMWATIAIYSGREDNIIWQRSGVGIQAYSATSLSEKQVFSLSDRGIHSVTNPIGRLTGAVHVYGGDFFAPGRSEWDPETLSERPFDVEATKRSFQEAVRRYERGR